MPTSSRDATWRSIGAQLLGGIVASGPVLAALGFAAHHFYKKSKQAKLVVAKPGPAVAAPKVSIASIPESATAPRPTRPEYKVQQGRVLQEQEEGDDAGLSGIGEHENEIQMLDEADVDMLQQDGGDNQKMLKMLQAMGFKVVIPDDGSGQMFLVPPGADPNNIPKVSDGDEILYRGMLDERPQDDDGEAQAQMMYDIGEEMGQMGMPGMDEEFDEEGEFLEEGEEFEEAAEEDA
ncbi:MAG: hypothetical protein WDW38_005478 [Sanguina aurantia]